MFFFRQESNSNSLFKSPPHGKQKSPACFVFIQTYNICNIRFLAKNYIRKNSYFVIFNVTLIIILQYWNIIFEGLQQFNKKGKTALVNFAFFNQLHSYKLVFFGVTGLSTNLLGSSDIESYFPAGLRLPTDHITLRHSVCVKRNSLSPIQHVILIISSGNLASGWTK